MAMMLDREGWRVEMLESTQRRAVTVVLLNSKSEALENSTRPSRNKTIRTPTLSKPTKCNNPQKFMMRNKPQPLM
jgi:hypothetical protein